jgi:hypothetical protein
MEDYCKARLGVFYVHALPKVINAVFIRFGANFCFAASSRCPAGTGEGAVPERRSRKEANRP